MRITGLLITALLIPGAGVAQYGGQYPGGQYPGSGPYPGGGYPGGTGIGIPGIPGIHLPKKKAKPETSSSSKLTVQSVDGLLRKLGEKDLVLQVSGDKILRFVLDDKTEFRAKDGKPVRDSLLHPGDHLTIDVAPGSFETALRVILNKAGSEKERASASAPVLEMRVMTPDVSDFGKPHGVTDPDAAGVPAPSDSISSAPPPPLGSRSDSDRPTLHRQVESDSAPAAAAVTAAPPSAAPSVTKDNSVDAVIDDARDASASFAADLPNFLVQQITTRFQGSRSFSNWRLMDTVTADVASVNGKEDYRNIKVNGKATDRPEDSGSWSTGEFQVTLDDVLSSRTAARFTARGEDRISNRPAFVFDLAVDQPHSHWTLVGENGRRIKPAYKGKIWIDKETRRVLRIEQTAVGIPRDFDFDTQESSLEYGFVNIDGRSYLLPVESINVACGTGTSNCSKNRIEFRNYRKFSSDSSITFGN